MQGLHTPRCISLPAPPARPPPASTSTPAPASPPHALASPAPNAEFRLASLPEMGYDACPAAAAALPPTGTAPLSPVLHPAAAAPPPVAALLPPPRGELCLRGPCLFRWGLAEGS